MEYPTIVNSAATKVASISKWKIENTGVTSTQKKIVIAAGTKLKYNVTYKGFGNSIAKFDIKYTGNAVIRYQYNKEDGTTGIITIDKSGIYHLPASVRTQKNFGFYCNRRDHLLLPAGGKR